MNLLEPITSYSSFLYWLIPLIPIGLFVKYLWKKYQIKKIRDKLFPIKEGCKLFFSDLGIEKSFDFIIRESPKEEDKRPFVGDKIIVTPREPDFKLAWTKEALQDITIERIIQFVNLYYLSDLEVRIEPSMTENTQDVLELILSENLSEKGIINRRIVSSFHSDVMGNNDKNATYACIENIIKKKGELGKIIKQIPRAGSKADVQRNTSKYKEMISNEFNKKEKERIELATQENKEVKSFLENIRILEEYDFLKASKRLVEEADILIEKHKKLDVPEIRVGYTEEREAIVPKIYLEKGEYPQEKPYERKDGIYEYNIGMNTKRRLNEHLDKLLKGVKPIEDRIQNRLENTFIAIFICFGIRRKDLEKMLHNILPSSLYSNLFYLERNGYIYVWRKSSLNEYYINIKVKQLVENGSTLDNRKVLVKGKFTYDSPFIHNHYRYYLRDGKSEILVLYYKRIETQPYILLKGDYICKNSLLEIDEPYIVAEDFAIMGGEAFTSQISLDDLEY